MAALLLALGAGCANPGEPRGPDFHASEQPALVGPAPLRRLSNDEYRNALRDLFPAVDMTLPALPEDGVVAGFENAIEGQTVSDVRIARYEEIARLVAQAAVVPDAFDALVGCAHASEAEQSACGRAFAARQGARIFRRPLAADELDRFALRFERMRRAVDFAGAVELTLSAMLQAPQFLYRPEPASDALAPVEPYAMASRLSFLLWESVPDDALYEAAATGALETPAQVTAQARRMLNDARARRTLWDFHRQWLALDRVLGEEHSARAREVDPTWSPVRQASAAEETRLFVERVGFEEGTLAALLTSRRAFVDAEMAGLYGVPRPAGEGAFSEVELPEDERSGLLTRAAFLVATSHRGATSPPVRANSINLRLLCRLPADPPPGVDISVPMPVEGEVATNRTLYEQRTAAAQCQACHVGLNGLGFGLENYDAAGRYTELDHGLPVDARGLLSGTDVDGPFSGAVELSERLAASRDVQDCAVERWLRFALGRGPSDVETPWANALAADFSARGGDLRALLTAIAASDTFRLRAPEDAP